MTRKVDLDTYNPDISWVTVVDLLAEIEGSALVSRMLIRALVRGRYTDDEKFRVLATARLLDLSLKFERLLAYTWPDPELDKSLEDTINEVGFINNEKILDILGANDPIEP